MTSQHSPYCPFVDQATRKSNILRCVDFVGVEDVRLINGNCCRIDSQDIISYYGLGAEALYRHNHSHIPQNIKTFDQESAMLQSVNLLPFRTLIIVRSSGPKFLLHR